MTNMHEARDDAFLAFMHAPGRVYGCGELACRAFEAGWQASQVDHAHPEITPEPHSNGAG